MTQEELIAYLETEDYKQIREIPGRGLCGLMRFAFTTGLVYGITEDFYAGRYCYKNAVDAFIALETWTGEGDPPDADWIKHKGRVEYSNPLKHDKDTD